MSQESLDWLEDNVLVGFTATRGNAWWHQRGFNSNNEPNHFEGAIPVEEVIRRLCPPEQDAVSGENHIHFIDNSGTEQVIIDPNRQSILNPVTGDVFGVFKMGYKIHQFREWLLEQTSNILDQSQSELGIANAVKLKKGAVMAIQYEVPENVALPYGVEIRPSLLAATSLDGTLSTTYQRVVTNVVCDNTMAAALSEKSARVKYKHSLNSIGKLQDLRASLEIEFIVDEFTKSLETLVETKVSPLQFKQFLSFYAPLTKLDKKGNPTDEQLDGRALTVAETKRSKLVDLWVADERVAPWNGTAYGIVQMNNTYNQHVAPTNKGTVRTERNYFEAAKGDLQASDAETLDLLFEKVLANA